MEKRLAVSVWIQTINACLAFSKPFNFLKVQLVFDLPEISENVYYICVHHHRCRHKIA